MSEQFGKLLKQIRLDSGHESLGEISKLSGISVATLSRIESGVQHPTPATLKKITPFLRNTTYMDLMVAAGYIQKGYPESGTVSAVPSSALLPGPFNRNNPEESHPGKELANYISSYMKERNLSAKDLSLATDLSESLVENILSGNQAKPSPDTLKKLAEALGASYSTMVKLAGIIIKNSSDLSEKEKEGTSAIWCRAEGLTDDDLAEVLALIAAKERRRKKGETNR